MAVIIYYRPPKTAKQHKPDDVSMSIPEDYKLSFMERRVTLSGNQGAILSFIEVRSYPDRYVSQDSIESEFSKYSKVELFYRLEHLRLLGFIEKQGVGEKEKEVPQFVYRLSPEYHRKLGEGRIMTAVQTGYIANSAQRAARDPRE
jgi:hypothetical protein